MVGSTIYISGGLMGGLEGELVRDRVGDLAGDFAEDDLIAVGFIGESFFLRWLERVTIFERETKRDVCSQ